MKPLKILRKSLGINIDEIALTTGLARLQIEKIEGTDTICITESNESLLLIEFYSKSLKLDPTILKYCFIRGSFSDIENRIAQPIIGFFTYLIGLFQCRSIT